MCAFRGVSTGSGFIRMHSVSHHHSRDKIAYRTYVSILRLALKRTWPPIRFRSRVGLVDYSHPSKWAVSYFGLPKQPFSHTQGETSCPPVNWHGKPSGSIGANTRGPVVRTSAMAPNRPALVRLSNDASSPVLCKVDA